MNDKQIKLSKAFLLVTSSLFLALTLVISFAVYQGQLAQRGDIFDKVVADQHMSWIFPTLILFIGIGATVTVLFIGMWHINIDMPHADE
jgi:hypothetical protein